MSTHPPVDIPPERTIAHLQHMLQEVHAELDKCGVPDCGPPAARVAMLAEAFRRRAVKMETEMAELRAAADAAIAPSVPGPAECPPALADALGPGWTWLTETGSETATLLHAASGSHARITIEAARAMDGEIVVNFARMLNAAIVEAP